MIMSHSHFTVAASTVAGTYTNDVMCQSSSPTMKRSVVKQCIVGLCLSFIMLLVPLSRAQEDPSKVFLWWEHDEFGHRDLVERLKRYSARLQAKQQSSLTRASTSSTSSPKNPLVEAFEQTNTHAFVIQGPHPARAENIRNFSRSLGFTETGGKHLTKIHTVLYVANVPTCASFLSQVNF